MFAYYKLCPKCQHRSHHQNTLPAADSKRRVMDLCHNIFNEETWAGPGCWNQTCSMQRRPAVPPEPDTIKTLSASGWGLFFARAFSAFGVCKGAHQWHRNSSVRQHHARPRVGHAQTQTHRQSEMEAPAQSIPTPSWGQQWNQEAHLAYFGQPLQKLFALPVTQGELATTGKQVKKKIPHILQLRNNWGNFFTTNTNKILGVCKLSMVLKASDLVC